jgi:CRP-like cAMP-binding protein
MRSVPRPKRRVDETPEAQALDATAREFHRVEERLEALREQLRRDAIAAVRAGMSRAEAARRSGYTREYVSRLVTEAAARDSLERRVEEIWTSKPSSD